MTTNKLKEKYKSWAVLNDGSQLFKDTVIKYLNENYGTKWSGIIGDFYGIDKYGRSNWYHLTEHFDTILTLDEFIKLTTMEKLEIKKEKAIEVYNNSCPDVKKVIEGLFGKETFEEENEFVPFVKDINSFNPEIVNGELQNKIEIGEAVVHNNMRGRCLVLSNDYNWEIICNDARVSERYTKLLVCRRKK